MPRRPLAMAALPPLALLVLGAAIFANSLPGVFVYDDHLSIVDNEHVRSLSPLGQALGAPADSPVAGRPIVALSLAINYALGGLDPRGYRVVNIGVHVINALLLYALLRRTLTLPGLRKEPLRAPAGQPPLTDPGTHLVAFAAAALWMAHPLNNECVNYITQRTESLMAMFQLATLWCAARAWARREAASPRRASNESPAPARGCQSPAVIGWSIAAVICCGLGMACKESMAVAPILVVLYDLAFRRLRFSELWRRRRGLYAGLAATWAVLLALNWHQPRAASVGLDLHITSWQYLLNQAHALPTYVKLIVWPDPLSIDYGSPAPRTLADAWLAGAVILAILAATIIVWRFNRPLGFVGAWCFLQLAPTSSFVPIVTEVAAERRMYLPLMAIIAMIVVALRVHIDKWTKSKSGFSPPLRPDHATLVIWTLALVALGWLTALRNRDYQSVETLWRSAIAAVPGNPRAHNNLALELAARGRLDEAIEHYRISLRLHPGAVDVMTNLGNALFMRGDIGGAMEQYRQVIAGRPDHAGARNSLAWVLATGPGMTPGQAREAVELALQAAEMTGWRDPAVLDTLAAAHAADGRFDLAINTALQALQLATHARNDGLPRDIAVRLDLYRRNQRWIETVPPLPRD